MANKLIKKTLTLSYLHFLRATLVSWLTILNTSTQKASKFLPIIQSPQLWVHTECELGKKKWSKYSSQFSSVQFSHSVMSNSLRPHGLQHARPPCPSPTPRVYPNSCPSSQWCHPTISSSVVPFFSHLQSFPALGSFQMSQLFTSGGQSNGVSALASVLPMNIQDWSPFGWTGWISFLSKGLSGVLQHHSSKASILRHSAFFIIQLSHPYLTTGKTILWQDGPLLAK